MSEKPSQLRLTLEKALLEKLDALVPRVSESVAVQELGVVVDRHLVARIALLRGIALMAEQDEIVQHQPQAKPKATAVNDTTTPPGKHGQGQPSKQPEGESDMERNEDGTIKAPPGWTAWVGDRVPDTHSGLHDYYTASGWQRYVGKSGDETIHFYWSPDEALHGVPVYDIPDTKGKTVVLQETPYGPGHIIPYGWAGEAG